MKHFLFKTWQSPTLHPPMSSPKTFLSTMSYSDIFPHSSVIDHPDNGANRKLLLVHPSDCRDILKLRNSNNRYIRSNVVARIKTDIETGNYLPTHQAIAFDNLGMLQDGQHRVKAIADADISVALWVQINQPQEYFKVLDSGTARLVSDNLAHHGALRSTIVAPGLKNAILYNRYPSRVWTNIVMPTTSEVIEIYDEDRELIDAISLACLEANKMYKPINKTGLFAACYLITLAGCRVDRVVAFCERLASGNNLRQGSPVLAYRNFLANSNRSSHLANLQQYSLNCIIKAWNYSILGHALKQFKPPAMHPMQKIVVPTNWMETPS